MYKMLPVIIIKQSAQIHTMKRISLICSLLGLIFPCSAQHMTVKAGTLVISPNTSLHFSGLTLTPSDTFTWSNKTLSKDTVASNTFDSTYVSRTYHFSNAQVFSGTVRIKYRDGELNGLTESDLKVGGYNGSSFQAVGNNSVNNITNDVTASGLTSYPIQELILATGIVLPLRLVNVSAIRFSSEVKINWKTAQESGVKHYDVQRSTGGVRWTTAISGVPAKNVPYPANYEAMDLPGFDGRLFYRIRQVDIDGNVFFSNVVSVAAYSTPGIVSIMPNPAKDNFSILGIDPGSIVTVDLSDATGHLVRRWNQSQNTYELTAMPAGIYYVRIQMDSKNIISKQVVVR
jgi:hypothetical protein